MAECINICAKESYSNGINRKGSLPGERGPGNH